MEELYNGIRLPDVWPPRNMDDMSLSELPVPYLENRPDVAEISSEIKKGLEIRFVSHMDEVLKAALVKNSEN